MTEIALEPGGHTLLLAPLAGSNLRGIPVAVSINVKPCVRYYLAAEQPARTSMGWTVVVDKEVPIEGCQKKEMATAEVR
jgi:hypothetical protein